MASACASFVQRPDDLPVDRPAGDAAEGQGQRGDQPEAGAVAAGGALAQLATGFGEGPAGPGHILGAALHRLLRLARADDAGTELLDAATIALEAAHGLFQRRIGLAGQWPRSVVPAWRRASNAANAACSALSLRSKT